MHSCSHAVEISVALSPHSEIMERIRLVFRQRVNDSQKLKLSSSLLLALWVGTFVAVVPSFCQAYVLPTRFPWDKRQLGDYRQMIKETTTRSRQALKIATAANMDQESEISGGGTRRVNPTRTNEAQQQPQQTESKKKTPSNEAESFFSSVASSVASPTLGDWEEMEGNFILRPPMDASPRALIHFLGGAIVGAAPQTAYRYLLEKLADEGYLVVATPYQLSFDHLETCDTILSKFEKIAPTLARTYGALPVVGIGHSTGSLLQLIITSLFPDTPRAANALISYNNKPVQEAVPFFDELVKPFFNYVVAREETNRRNGAEIIALTLQLLKSQTLGNPLPRDELLQQIIRALMPIQLDQQLEEPLQNLKVPDEVRQLLTTVTKGPTTALSQAGLIPLAYNFLEALEQIPPLIEEVADGSERFTPLPAQVEAVAKRAYRARQTLILKFSEDQNFDESDEIEELVRAAGQVIRNKRPMVQIQVTRKDLPGGHETPLIAPPLELATQSEDLLGPQAAREQLQYQKAYDTVQVIAQWLEDCNL